MKFFGQIWGSNLEWDEWKNGDIEALADAMRALKKKKTITAMPNLFPLIISFNWIS